MKLDPHLPQLPSLSELLEHPRVKGVVARINRSTLAHRATGFLEEWKASLVERAGRVEIPSVTQLAERLARRLLGDPLSSGPLINATGMVVGDPDLTPPLADAAVHAMMQVAGEYHGRGGELTNAVLRELCRLSGAEAALVLDSFEASLNVVAASMLANRDVLVAGSSDSREVGVDWPRLAARHAAVLRTTAGDAASLSTAIQDGRRVGALLRSPEAEGLASTVEFAANAKQVGAIFVDVAPLAGVLSPDAYGLQAVDTLHSRIAAGADVVIADGSGLLGGPSCGIILGKRALVEPAASNYLASLAKLSAASAAALHATLALYRDDHDGSAIFSIPVWQLLSAPLANLEQRAKRLAAIIEASPLVASVEAQPVESPWCGTHGPNRSAQSWAILIRPKTGDAASSLAQLRQRPYAIIGTEADGDVQLDLRSVFPRWDQQLVAAFQGAEE